MVNRNDVERIVISEGYIEVFFKDGLIGKERIKSYPALDRASQQERNAYTLSHFGIHWPYLDEDLSFEGFYRNAKSIHFASMRQQ